MASIRHGLSVSELVLTTGDKDLTFSIEFKLRCGRKLADLGDLAMRTRQHDEAISQYSAAVSLNPVNLPSLLIKRSKARANMGLWEDALNDANQVHYPCPVLACFFVDRGSLVHHAQSSLTAGLRKETRRFAWCRTPS